MRKLPLLLILLSTSLSFADDPIATTHAESIPKDPAAEIIAGVDRFLLRKWDAVDQQRASFWKTKDQFAENRDLLKQIIGLEPQRHPATDGMLHGPRPIAVTKSFAVQRVRWPVLSHPAPQTSAAPALWGEGIHLQPARPNRTLVVILPDADESPEHWLPFGLIESTETTKWRKSLATELATNGSDVIVMDTIGRQIHKHRNAKQSRREYLHRAAFQLGRTLTGYEIQMAQAIIDRFADYNRIVICGSGEGGMVAMMTAAIDKRVDVTLVGNYFGRHGPQWSEPISRTLFNFNERFSDGYLAALISPREFRFFADKRYQVTLPGEGGAPAEWDSRDVDDAAKTLHALQMQRNALKRVDIQFSGRRVEATSIASTIAEDLAEFANSNQTSDANVELVGDSDLLQEKAAHRENRLFATIDAYNQLLLAESSHERAAYLNIGNARSNARDGSNVVDTESLEHYTKSMKKYRDDFRDNVIGWFHDERLPPNARSRPAMKGTNWQGHEVMLDVFPDVVAYGVLLMPNGLSPDKKYPVVVCQHGLEGRPQDTIQGDHRAYHNYAARLAEKGYIVFAPQNLYIGKDDFRTLQRKSYPLGKTLFSIIGAQHQQIIRWLKTIPAVDPDRIAFYGLSYGGKTAMRVPAILPEYCLSICSADFNDWVWKNASTRSTYSYIGTGEYEIFEWGLGKKYNYAEMAALIAPRPFMVERGHHDGVAPDDRVAKEFAKVRYLYQARLKLKEQCEIEFFDGPHTINGKGTFDFLDRHLRGKND